MGCAARAAGQHRAGEDERDYGGDPGEAGAEGERLDRLPLDHAAEEGAKRAAFDNFLGDLRVEQRHYTRENRMLLQNRKSLVIQERMYFRNIPLSDWIEHEIVVDDGADVTRLLQDLTVFDKGVVSIEDIPRQQRKALA